MSRHTLNDTTAANNNSAIGSHPNGHSSGFNSPSRGTPVSGSGSGGVGGGPLAMSGFTPGSAFGGGSGNERDLFSSGLGGIIGGGTISHSNTLPSFNHLTHSSLANKINSGSYQHQLHNGYDHTMNGGSGGSAHGIGSGLNSAGLHPSGDDGGVGMGHSGSSALMGSTLSASALPFLADSALDRSGQQQQQRMVGSWDH